MFESARRNIGAANKRNGENCGGRLQFYNRAFSEQNSLAAKFWKKGKLND
jgi:hypothetical protein